MAALSSVMACDLPTQATNWASLQAFVTMDPTSSIAEEPAFFGSRTISLSDGFPSAKKQKHRSSDVSTMREISAEWKQRLAEWLAESLAEKLEVWLDGSPREKEVRATNGF